jgi:hypothetical protein
VHIALLLTRAKHPGKTETTMTPNPDDSFSWDSIGGPFAAAARIGHTEGKERCGAYVIDEELVAAHVAVDDQGELLQGKNRRREFFRGYCYGYKLGASGDDLPEDCQAPSWLRELMARTS